MLVSQGHEELVRVTRCTSKRVGGLKERDARLLGVPTLSQLEAKLKIAHPRLRDSGVVTVVEFESLLRQGQRDE